MRTVASALATALFTLFVPAIVAVGVPQTWIREAGVVVAPGIASRIVGSALVALGTIGYFWCATLFVKAQGTPAPVFPTQKTVVGGLYRVNRNPMYTSVLAVVFGQALLYRYGTLAIYGAVLALCSTCSSSCMRNLRCARASTANMRSFAGASRAGYRGCAHDRNY